MTKSNITNRIIALLIPVVVLLGNFSIGGARVAGVVITYYRLFIPVFFIVVLLLDFQEASGSLGRNTLAEQKMTKALLGVTFIWLVYGVTTIFLFPYATMHEGLQELLALVLGVMTAVIIIIVCADGASDYVVAGIKIALAITLLIGLYELLTANHLSTARVSDPEFIRRNQEIFGAEAENLKFYVAMSVCNNENDYSALIAVLSPFYFLRTGKSRVLRVLDILALCLALIILYQNNAFICFVAFILGIVIALVVALKTWNERIGITAALVLTRIALALGIIRFGDGAASMSATLLAQLENDNLGMGSMYYRINTYRVTLIETFRTSKGLGFGAGSFTNYFSQLADSEKIMINPHCFWFEILSEYGVLIFGLFALFLIILMLEVIRKMFKAESQLPAVVGASGFALIIASVAPSSYLKTGYYWIPVALAVFIADYNDDLEKKGNLL